MGINLADYCNSTTIELSDEKIEELADWYMEKYPDGYESFSEDLHVFFIKSSASFKNKEYINSDSPELGKNRKSIEKIQKKYIKNKFEDLSSPIDPERDLVA
ncbi:hypothetical protein [Candidatus Enterococcus clewellii]|uniref:Uncharacterized protein n=1 Tax=Candidatus Enterococcus clewellii TaxID=1834193 RepID=A0AAQ3Y250_9ENTE